MDLKTYQLMEWIFHYFLTLLIFLPKAHYFCWTFYSYENKRLSLLNAYYLLNTPTWTPKIKQNVQAFIRSFTETSYVNTTCSVLNQCLSRYQLVNLKVFALIFFGKTQQAKILGKSYSICSVKMFVCYMARILSKKTCLIWDVKATKSGE